MKDLCRYRLFGRLTQMAFRRSRVRSASAPPIKSRAFRLLNIAGRPVVVRWSDVAIFAGRTATATIATPIGNAVQFSGTRPDEGGRAAQKTVGATLTGGRNRSLRSAPVSE